MDDIDRLVASLMAGGMPEGHPALDGEQWLHRLDTLRAQFEVFETSFTVEVTRADGIDVYVQVSRETGGYLAEAVSNEYLSTAGILGPEQVSRLLELGWSAPAGDDGPNFFRRADASLRGREELAVVLALTLREGYGVTAEDVWGLLPASLMDRLNAYQTALDGAIGDIAEEAADVTGPNYLVGFSAYSAKVTSRFADDLEADLEWRFCDIREDGQIVVAAAYRAGEYVYCQRGPDDGFAGRVKVGHARGEIPQDPGDWDDLATYRALFFGVARGRVAEAFGVAEWGSAEEALGGIVGVFASGIDQDCEVTTFAFPSYGVATQIVRPDRVARRKRENAEEAARVQAADAEAQVAEENETAARRAAEAHEVVARRAARAKAQDDAIDLAELRAQQERQLVDRLQDTDLLTPEDLLAAFAVTGEGPHYLAAWGRAIVEAVEQFIAADTHDFMSGSLLTLLKDTALKRYQTLTPFQGMLEAPEEINVLYQNHVDAFEHLLRVREKALSGLLSDVTWRLIQHLSPLSWGELARFGAVRDYPARPDGQGTFDDFED